MNEKYRKDTGNVVTHYQRQAANPVMPLGDTDIVDEHLDKSDLPKRLRFSLKSDNSIIAEVALNHEIILGRRARKSDPQVTVDVENFGGHEQGVSRVHAMIGVLRDTIIVQDLQSINGTYIQEQRLLPLKKYPLRDGAALSLSNLHLIVTYLFD